LFDPCFVVVAFSPSFSTASFSCSPHKMDLTKTRTTESPSKRARAESRSFKSSCHYHSSAKAADPVSPQMPVWRKSGVDTIEPIKMRSRTAAFLSPPDLAQHEVDFQGSRFGAEVVMTSLRATVIMKTDMSGSTARLRQLPESDLGVLFVEHQSLVARAASSHDGRIVKTEGDGFCTNGCSPWSSHEDRNGSKGSPSSTWSDLLMPNGAQLEPVFQPRPRFRHVSTTLAGLSAVRTHDFPVKAAAQG